MNARNPRGDSRNERIKAYRWGLSAETVASFYLRLKGYRILARRHKTPFGEIDLIVRRGGLIGFVEVKARAAHLDAIEAVDAKSRGRIIAAASHWGARHPEVADLSWRYDIVSIVPWRRPRHLVDAFRPES